MQRAPRFPFTNRVAHLLYFQDDGIWRWGVWQHNISLGGVSTSRAAMLSIWIGMALPLITRLLLDAWKDACYYEYITQHKRIVQLTVHTAFSLRDQKEI